ncbi:restriction endonuclease subunit S [Bacteroides thetaiotaomicron]|jgi:type I restriction enzyme S subunit|uniref:restriction endonuclease subunit S n=1 Tax=Bacteroidaceae TaxID=815 RepID=UPI001CCD61A0|nr:MULTISPECIES: restriction endonuclease subunit S [Bacteroides]MCB7241860.1 restriction endonuclease subunit S [Bacteroides thetaiotaomicron]MCS3071904.1 restriction endonuclease subunit S [Bacteroides thetaiotaomicron]UBF13232.1 restriction endonuclease subunit S [Bacteroides caccae]UVQ67569.1 restriction endonuclease subunit S [Bacteroides thetaiotaomicron]
MGNVPNLRFPEFSEEWKKMKVSELLDFYSTNSLSWEQLDYNNGKIKNLHYGLIHKGVPTMVDVVCDSLPYIKEESMPKSFTLFKEGDVAFADASEDTNDVAKAIEVVNCDNQQIVSGLHTIHGRDNYEQTIIGYKGYAFASDSFHKQIRRIAQGTKVFSISARNFDEVYIGIPSKEEQTKIAKLLIAIDKRIATQNKIIEDLKKLKSAIYQEIFSNLQGEECSLLDLAEIIKGQQINGSELSDSGKYYVMNGGIAPSGYYDSYNTEADTISISEGGNSCGYVQYNSSEFWSGGHCYTLRIKPTSSIATHFLFHYLKWKEPDIMALRIGSGLPNIQKKDLSKISIIVPTLDKQLQLTVLLSAFKKKIENEEMYVANLDKQKQYLLQQMFI